MTDFPPFPPMVAKSPGWKPNHSPTFEWYCPSCDRRSITREYVPQARPHACTGRLGLQIPMVLKGDRATHVVREREDYIGRELVQYAPENGRPVMALETHHDDGRVDAVAYAPTATTQAG